MKLQMLNAPHVHAKDSAASLMGDMIIAMVPLYVMAAYYYGPRAIMLGVVSMVTAYLCDQICTALRGRGARFFDISGLVTGMILPLLLPATAPYWMVIVAAVFAIVVIKHPFGGFGNNLFNPAAGAFCFISLSWPSIVFQYPVPFDPIPLFGEVTTKVTDSAAGVLQLGGLPSVNPIELLLGNTPGPMGATSVLVLAMCGLYLIVRGTIRWQIPVSFLSVTLIIAFLFPRISSGDRLDSVLFELTSGTILFGAVFVLTDPVTSPRLRLSKTIYAGLCGIIVMMFRYFGAYQQGLAFAVILVNAFAGIIDSAVQRIRYNNRTNKDWMLDDYRSFVGLMRQLKPQFRPIHPPVKPNEVIAGKGIGKEEEDGSSETEKA